MESFESKFKKQEVYFKSNPPSSLIKFKVESINELDIEWDGHGGDQINSIFSLTCECGNQFFGISGFKWINPDFNNMEVFLSPIEVSCTNCNDRTIIFDSNIHGYDAVLGHGSTTVNAKGDKSIIDCNSCNGNIFKIFARYEYSTDLFDGDFDDNGPKQDLFSWMTMACVCMQCNSLSTLTEFECA